MTAGSTLPKPLDRRALATACLVAALAAAAAPSPLHAQSSPYYIGALLSYGSDSNLLRISDNGSAPADYSKSDTTLGLAVLAGFDETISRQRVRGNFLVRANRYDRNGIYDNDSYSASAGWDWVAGQRLSGALNVSAARNLSSFNLLDIGLLTDKNEESTESVDASLRWGLVGVYSLDAGIGQRRAKNSLDDARIQGRNYVQDTADVGVSWRPGADTRLGLGLRRTEGRYPRFRTLADGSYEADRFQRNDIDLTSSSTRAGPAPSTRG